MEDVDLFWIAGSLHGRFPLLAPPVRAATTPDWRATKRPITGTVVDALNARFGTDNVRILMLFRNHFPFVESVYAQFLKGGLFRTPQDVFAGPDRGGITAFAASFRQRNGFDFFSYGDFIERMRFHAPFNPFDLLSIERADWGGQDVLDVLCARLGVSRGDEAVASPSPCWAAARRRAI